MTNNSFKDSFLRAIAVIGLIAVLILGAWGIIQIAFNLPSFLSGTGSAISGIFHSKPATVKESTSVSLPQTVNSGEPFTISWKHQNGTSTYSYAVSYACATGLSVKAPTPSGTFKTVPCATPFNYTNAANTMQLTATATTTGQIAASFAVASIDLSSGAVTSIGTSSITVLPTRNATTTAPATTTTTKPKPSTTKVVTTNRHTSNPYGAPNLTVQVLSLTPMGNGLTQMVFQIANVGDKTASAGWSFSAQLPIGYSYQYTSAPQQAMYPGDRIVYTLTYSDATNSQYNNQSNGCTTGTYPYTYQNCYNYTNNYNYTSGYNYTGVNNAAQYSNVQPSIIISPMY
jgi:predicted RecA/RadA family phage recombinase